MDNISKSVRTGYDRFGEYFSRSRAKNWPDVAQMARKLPEGVRVLDVGCGNGRLIETLPYKTKYLGIDFSETLLKEARRLHPDAKFIQQDITKLSAWKDLAKFDVIFCVAVLHHIPQREQQLSVLKQIRRHLAPGGFAYVTVWNLYQPQYWTAHLKSWKHKLLNWRWILVPFMNRWDRFCVAFDSRYLGRLAHEAGFDSASIKFKDKQGRTASVFNAHNLTAVLR